jgi:DNA-binding phage protein
MWPGGPDARGAISDRRSEAARAVVRDAGGMHEAANRAADDVAMRRAALDQALAALDRGDPDADPIAVVDCALALQAAEAAAGPAALSAPGLRA